MAYIPKERNACLIFFNWLNQLDRFSDERAGIILLSLLRYAAKGTVPVGLSDREDMLFTVFRDQEDYNRDEFYRKKQINSENARKRYQDKATADDGKQPPADDNQRYLDMARSVIDKSLV